MASLLEESIKTSIPPVAPHRDIHCLLMQDILPKKRFESNEMPADARVVRLATLLALWRLLNLSSGEHLENEWSLLCLLHYSIFFLLF